MWDLVVLQGMLARGVVLYEQCGSWGMEKVANFRSQTASPPVQPDASVMRKWAPKLGQRND